MENENTIYSLSCWQLDPDGDEYEEVVLITKDKDKAIKMATDNDKNDGGYGYGWFVEKFELDMPKSDSERIFHIRRGRLLFY